MKVQHIDPLPYLRPFIFISLILYQIATFVNILFPLLKVLLTLFPSIFYIACKSLLMFGREEHWSFLHLGMCSSVGGLQRASVYFASKMVYLLLALLLAPQSSLSSRCSLKGKGKQKQKHKLVTSECHLSRLRR